MQESNTIKHHRSALTMYFRDHMNRDVWDYSFTVDKTVNMQKGEYGNVEIRLFADVFDVIAMYYIQSGGTYKNAETLKDFTVAELIEDIIQKMI